MNPAQWPETVAAGISLIEVALGPEIAEEAFNIVMGMDTFEAACRRADAKVKRDEHNDRLRALLCDDLSLVSADSGEGGQAFHLKADSESGRWRTAFR